MLELRKEGLTIKEIARRFDMAERTIRWWLMWGIPMGNQGCVVNGARDLTRLFHMSPSGGSRVNAMASATSGSRKRRDTKVALERFIASYGPCEDTPLLQKCELR